MAEAAEAPRKVAHGLARKRALRALAAAVLAGLVVLQVTQWQNAQNAVMVGWDVGALVFLLTVWRRIAGMSQPLTAEIARMQDDSRATTDVILLAASVFSLLGVFLVIVKAQNQSGLAKAAPIVVGLLGVASAWTIVHTLYTLRYSNLYYEDPIGGIDFHGDGHPRFSDFAYLAFTVGMTFQVSDTEVNSAEIRSQLLRHSLLSYIFGAVIVAISINLVAGLL